MNKMQIFQNQKFGELRTLEIEGKLYFVASDIAKALGYANSSKAVSDHCRWVTKCYIPHPQNPTKNLEVNAIPEGDMYRLITSSELSSAQEFETWVFDDVLPSIRKTGSYTKPLSQLEIMQQSIQILNEHDSKIKAIDNRMDKLEYEIPLYGSEADELSNHVKRKGVAALGGKKTNAYQDPEIRSKVYRDIYDQLKREFGLYAEDGKAKSYKALKRKYIYDAHEFVDSYETSIYLQDLIDLANAQMNLEIAG